MAAPVGGLAIRRSPMIAIAKKSRPTLTSEHHQLFLAMLPKITEMAHIAFRELDAEGKQEATAEVVASAYIMFVALVEQGRERLAYSTVLAMYGIKRVKIGRMAATPMNVRDVSSTYCQLKKGVRIERLDTYDRDTQSWQEILVEDRRAGPADVAATRIDFASWLRTLRRRDRRIAETLSAGETTGTVAKRFHVSAARVSQLRRQLKDSWDEFVGESDVTASGTGGAT
jgi:hypothetical protein